MKVHHTQTDVVENLPYEVDWIPVQEGQFNLPKQDRTVSLRYIKTRAYERVYRTLKILSVKKQMKLLIMLKKDCFK
jgi:hypothetical protein